MTGYLVTYIYIVKVKEFKYFRFLLIIFTLSSLIATFLCIYTSPHFPEGSEPDMEDEMEDIMQSQEQHNSTQGPSGSDGNQSFSY